MKHKVHMLTAVAAVCAATACTTVPEPGSPTPDTEAIVVTGSATVEPITTYIAQHGAQRGDVNVHIEAIGSTDGFARFCNGEADINDASVPIPGPGAGVDYQKACADSGVSYVELPIALDAITLVKNAHNTWAQDLSVAQLREIWSADSQVTRWSDIDPAWPDDEIVFSGRPVGSGTLDVFTSTVLGGEDIRDDYQATDDIDELSSWIADDPNSLGFMGIGNYLATTGTVRDRIDNVLVDGVAPGREETQSGHYPLARPLFLYVNTDAAERDVVDRFVTNYLDKVEEVLPRVYYYQLAQQEYEQTRQRYVDRVTGADERWQPKR